MIPAKVFGKWLVKDKPELADEMLEAGATQFLYKLVGYEIKAVKQLTTAEMLVEQAKLLLQHEQRLTTIELENIELKKKLAEHDERIVATEELVDANADELSRFKNGHGYWYSVVGYCNKHGITDYSLQKAAILGRRATALCKKSGITPEKINDPRFGRVNVYPEHILDELTIK